VISVFLIRSGFLALLFLAPLGYAGFGFGRKTAWAAAACAWGFNALWSLGVLALVRRDFAEVLLDLGYFSLVTAAFTWLVAPPLGGPAFLRTRALYRLIAGALGAALLALALSRNNATGLGSLVRSQAEALSTLYVSSAGGDAVRRSLFEQELSPERIVAVFNVVLSRGGALASGVMVLFLNRQISLGLAALRRKRHPERGGEALPAASLKGFRAPVFLIWPLSGALAAILLLRITGFGLAEVAAWNVLTLCALIYLAQGLGIVQFALGRRDLPVLLRLVLNIGIILVVFSPGINVIALGLLVLLGITEQWVPLRAPSNRPPSTPAV
jgi:hypothetical protein